MASPDEEPCRTVCFADLAGYTRVGDWLDRFAGPFFDTRSSLDWFIKRNRRELIEIGAATFAERCVRGLKANAEINEWHSRTLIPMIATLARQYGYSTVTNAYKEANGDGERMKELLAARQPGA